MMVRTETTNAQTDKLPCGGSFSYPIVAIAYTWAILDITAGSTHAGRWVTFAYNGKSVTVTLDANGSARLNLLPFIREAAFANNILQYPFNFPDTDNIAANSTRGQFYLTITDAIGTKDIVVYYIFGAADPRKEITDVFFDYDPNVQNWGSYENTTLWVGGVPTNFANNYVNLATIVGGTTMDFTTPLDSVNYYGDKIVMSTITYHFRFDKRTENVMRLRWMDEAGNINERKFTTAGHNYEAAKGDTWERPHDVNVINKWDVYPGRDQFSTIEASETMVVGDDCIPMEMYDSYKSICSAPIVYTKLAGFWQKCQASAAIEADSRKKTFSITITLAIPTAAIQEF